MGARHVKGLEFSWAVGWQLAAPHRKAAVFLRPTSGESLALVQNKCRRRQKDFSVPTGLLTGSAGTVHT